MWHFLWEKSVFSFHQCWHDCNLLSISYIWATTQRNDTDHYPLIMEQDGKKDSNGQKLFAVSTLTKTKCSNSLLFNPKTMFLSDHFRFPYQELHKNKLLNKLKQYFLNKLSFHSQEKSVQKNTDKILHKSLHSWFLCERSWFLNLLKPSDFWQFAPSH